MSVSIAAAASILALLGLVLASLRRVPEGCAFTVHRFGRYVRTLPPGIGLVLPLVERVGQRVKLIGHAVPVRDMDLNAAVYYQIIDPRQAGEALESIDQVVERTARETLRGLPLADPAEGSIDQQVRTRLNQALAGRGLRVVRCVVPAVV